MPKGIKNLCLLSSLGKHADTIFVEILIIAWFALAVVLIVGELFSLDLTLAILGAGAGAAGVSAAVGAPLVVQVPIFFAVSLLGLVFVRPIAKKHLRTPKEIRTGIERLPGQAAIALEPVTIDGGLIKLDGETWSARLDELISSEPVAEGSRVTVLRIEGATAIVHAID